MAFKRRQVCSFSRAIIFALLFILHAEPGVRAQLGNVPPNPPVSTSAAADGMAATVGNESIRISVCRSSVIHFVATPEPARRSDQPWMLDANQSCPGAKFQFTQG